MPALLWLRWPLMIFPWNGQLLWTFLRILVIKMDVMLNQGTVHMEGNSNQEGLSSPGTFLQG
jgi:hypothetical protein